jgi:hypothetical protein
MAHSLLPKRIQPKTFNHTSLGYILILSSHLPLDIPGGFSSFVFLNYIFNAFLLLPCALHGRLSHLPNNISRIVQIKTICIIQFSPLSCFFFPRRSKFPHQHSAGPNFPISTQQVQISPSALSFKISSISEDSRPRG